MTPVSLSGIHTAGIIGILEICHGVPVALKVSPFLLCWRVTLAVLGKDLKESLAAF